MASAQAGCSVSFKTLRTFALDGMPTCPVILARCFLDRVRDLTVAMVFWRQIPSELLFASTLFLNVANPSFQ